MSHRGGWVVFVAIELTHVDRSWPTVDSRLEGILPIGKAAWQLPPMVGETTLECIR